MELFGLDTFEREVMDELDAFIAEELAHNEKFKETLNHLDDIKLMELDDLKSVCQRLESQSKQQNEQFLHIQRENERLQQELAVLTAKQAVQAKSMFAPIQPQSQSQKQQLQEDYHSRSVSPSPSHSKKSLFAGSSTSPSPSPSQKSTNTDTESPLSPYKTRDELEYLYAETRSRLARALEGQENQLFARELAEKELAHERVLRIHAEKERDAYAAAYDASLKHFDRWSQRKQLHKGSSSSSSSSSTSLPSNRPPTSSNATTVTTMSSSTTSSSTASTASTGSAMSMFADFANLGKK